MLKLLPIFTAKYLQTDMTVNTIGGHFNNLL